jgi:hypothetical protein
MSRKLTVLLVLPILQAGENATLSCIVRQLGSKLVSSPVRICILASRGHSGRGFHQNLVN